MDGARDKAFRVRSYDGLDRVMVALVDAAHRLQQTS